MERAPETISAWDAESVPQLAGSIDVQLSIVSTRKPQGGVPVHAWGGAIVHNTGGLLDETRCPAPSVGPRLTDKVFAGSVPSARHGLPGVHSAPPTVWMESMRRCGGSSVVDVLDESLLHAERTTTATRGSVATRKVSLNVENRKKVSRGRADASLASSE
jgi:hypothetical protein